MGRPSCRLRWHSASAHIQQVYTGLAMLHRAGSITLTQERVNPPAAREEVAQHLRDAGRTHASVVVNDTLTVHYDMHDACEIDLRDLDACDYYVKRSFSASHVATLPRGADKVLPFGLNYHVLPDFADAFAVRRVPGSTTGIGDRVAALRQALNAGSGFTFYPRVREFESAPTPALEPGVLFLATAYDPHDKPDRSAEKIEEREHANETRAQCIRLLRQELGQGFLGGFNHSAFTQQRYPDCLAADARVTDKKNYLRMVRAHPVCVATTGLHGSTGWKFAEYVAGARAIVSEPLRYAVPGEFASERNYLEFASPADCVEQALRLVADSALRERMMEANARYYRIGLRPDALLLNSLRSVAAKAARPSADAGALGGAGFAASL